MELSELTAYAKETYQIEEQHKWAEFPGFSVLVHPQTGHWVALLMRQWDSDLGEVVERCDLKCGEQTLSEFPLPYLILYQNMACPDTRSLHLPHKFCKDFRLQANRVSRE